MEYYWDDLHKSLFGVKDYRVNLLDGKEEVEKEDDDVESVGRT